MLKFNALEISTQYRSTVKVWSYGIFILFIGWSYQCFRERNIIYQFYIAYLSRAVLKSEKPRKTTSRLSLILEKVEFVLGRLGILENHLLPFEE